MNNRPVNTVNEIVSQMQKYGLGMRRKTLDLSDHNVLWARAFLWVKEKFENHLGCDHLYRIEHFGSTSIANLAAKPALDIMVIFKTELGLKASVSLFEGLGFIYKGDMVGHVNQMAADPRRHFFSFYDLEQVVDYIHLHVFLDDHPDVERNLGFRDLLRDNSVFAEEYAELKCQLKEQGLSRPERLRSKSSFISQSLRI